MPNTTRAANHKLIIVECVLLSLGSVILERMHLQTSTKVLLCVGLLLVAGIGGIIAAFRTYKNYTGWWPTRLDVGDKPLGKKKD